MKGMHVGRDVRRARWLHTAGRRSHRHGLARRGAGNRWLDRHVGPSTPPPPEPD